MTGPDVPLPESPPLLEARGITMRFGDVVANDDVTLQIRAGEVHAVLGENGAGKSTLVSILSGHYRADAGEIVLFGEPVKMASSADAIGHGIGMVHQHFMLVPNFTVLENLMLGLAKSTFLSASREDVRKRLADLQAAYGLAVDADQVVGTLPVGLQQRVEIIKALIGGGHHGGYPDKQHHNGTRHNGIDTLKILIVTKTSFNGDWRQSLDIAECMACPLLQVALVNTENVSACSFGRKREGAVKPDSHFRLTAAFECLTKSRRDFDNKSDLAFTQPVFQVVIMAQLRVL